MRYNIDDFDCDGKNLFVRGWALPEHKGDTLKVILQDLSGEEHASKIEYEERPDVLEALLHTTGDEKYGFRIHTEVSDLSDLVLIFDALEFDIDYARMQLHIKEAFQAYKKNARKRK